MNNSPLSHFQSNTSVRQVILMQGTQRTWGQRLRVSHTPVWRSALLSEETGRVRSVGQTTAARRDLLIEITHRVTWQSQESHRIILRCRMTSEWQTHRPASVTHFLWWAWRYLYLSCLSVCMCCGVFLRCNPWFTVRWPADITWSKARWWWCHCSVMGSFNLQPVKNFHIMSHRCYSLLMSVLTESMLQHSFTLCCKAALQKTVVSLFRSDQFTFISHLSDSAVKSTILLNIHDLFTLAQITTVQRLLIRLKPSLPS